MINYYRKSIEKAKFMLEKLRKNPENCILLVELQKLLISLIVRNEKQIIKFRKIVAGQKKLLSINRFTKEEALRVKFIIKNCEQKINSYKRLIYTWKCFGDGIVFSYLNKYCLKHSYYDKGINAKEDSGYISGKKGFIKEWRLVRILNKENLRCILCDITNILRHGDICSLISDEPYLVEIKSGNSSNKRTERQAKNLAELQNFYQNDEINYFRNNKNIAKKEMHLQEINYFHLMNECINRSYKEGATIISPEEGIYYCSIYQQQYNASKSDIIEKFTGIYFDLSLDMINEKWNPAFPYTLSIFSEHLYNFISGAVKLFVYIDIKVLKKRFLAHGIYATFINNSESALQISLDKDICKFGVLRISTLHFGRLGYEFQSLDWFIKENLLTLKELAEMPPGDPNSEFNEIIPEDWLSPIDQFE